MNGSYDFPRLLVEDVRAPVGVEEPQLFDQTVVLSQKECVQGNLSQVLVSPRVPWRTQVKNRLATKTWKEHTTTLSYVPAWKQEVVFSPRVDLPAPSEAVEFRGPQGSRCACRRGRKGM